MASPTPKHFRIVPVPMATGILSSFYLSALCGSSFPPPLLLVSGERQTARESPSGVEGINTLLLLFALQQHLTAHALLLHIIIILIIIVFLFIIIVVLMKAILLHRCNNSR